MKAAIVAVMIATGATLVVSVTIAEQNQPKLPLAQEHPIVIDATAIVPPRAWSVPGITEPLQSVRDRMMTNKVATIKLRPGRYMFMTTVFSFEFIVNLDGKLDYHKSQDKCVGGRGATTLMVKCSFNQQNLQ
jgi:hypothetical protein